MRMSSASRFASTAKAKPAPARPASSGLGRGVARRAPWLLLLAACSEPTDVQPFPGQCAPFEIVAYTPRDMAQDVPTNTPVDLTFSAYPDPDSLSSQSLVLTTGVFWHTGAYSVDLLSKTVRFRTPGSLRPNLGYSLNIGATLRSLQGCATSVQHRSFRTGDGPAAAPDVPTPPTFAEQVLPIFARSCAGAGCHRQPESEGGACLEHPAGSLSLCDAEAFDALVRIPSRQIHRLLLVVPRDAARSYLLRKLLPATPDVEQAPPLPTTIGHRDPPGAALPTEQLRAISDWIDNGATR